MASTFRSPVFTPLAAAALLALGTAARAQDASPSTPATPPATAAPQSVQIVGHNTADASGVTGFDSPLARTPLQAEAISTRMLTDIGATSLSDLTRVDASLTDSYNAVGYWTTFTLRGFQVDNKYNFRRDGLPINAETALPLENKSEVDVLKGLSGMQAGTSAPGGLVNLVVKRPDTDLRDVSLLWSQPGTIGVAADLSQRFGEARQFGARLNVSATRLDPNYRDDVGHRQTASLATDWRIDGDHLLEFEFEHSLQSQPSVPAFSMLGDMVPDPHAIDPHINLNDQPWSLPVVLQGNTMSLRYTQALAADWQLKLHALQQRLVSNDHLAFAYGLYDAATGDCGDYCHSFGSDGHYSIWDFRSDDERRQTRDLDVALSGRFATGALRHALSAGVLTTNFSARFNDEAYNLVGTGTIDGQTMVPSDPSTTTANTDRTERSTEFYLRDAVQVGADWTAWAGLRHSRLHRTSWPTSGDPSSATDYRQSFTTPWLALSRQFGERDMAYLSWGEGVESSVTPNLPTYKTPGQVQPATLSRQWEGGWKHASGDERWGLAAYDIVQPQWSDVTQDSTQDASSTNPLLHVRDGNVHARGLEAEAATRAGPFTLRASVMAQRVRTEGAGAATTPANVPQRALKALAEYAVPALPGLSVLVNMAYEGGREVTPSDSASIPGWTRYDLGARYTQAVRGATLAWRLGVDNVFDRRAWREAPYQYDHAYLFPLEPRTFHASLEGKF